MANRNQEHPAAIIIDIICWVIGIAAAIIFWVTSVTMWMWIAIAFGSLGVLIFLYIITDGFESTGSGGGFDFDLSFFD